jgi:hypothetical protein
MTMILKVSELLAPLKEDHLKIKIDVTKLLGSPILNTKSPASSNRAKTEEGDFSVAHEMR